nr:MULTISPECIES: hypothetical protein [unclassified Rhodococcus (in: high G+C Gram-positive bacteria)]
MSIPLTLGVPHRPEPGALVAGLLHQCSRSSERVERDADEVTSGPAIVSASVLRDHPGEPALGRLVVDLDIDPEELRRSRAVYEAVRFHLDVDAETIDDATALRVPSPLVLFPDLGDGPTLDAVTQIVEAHRIPRSDRVGVAAAGRRRARRRRPRRRRILRAGSVGFRGHRVAVRHRRSPAR